MIKNCFIFLCITFSLSACSVYQTKSNVLPRYISPAKYHNYTCNELRSAYTEMSSILAKIDYLIDRGKVASNRYIEWKSQNEISRGEVTIDINGYAILLGHMQAIKKLEAQNSSCNI